MEESIKGGSNHETKDRVIKEEEEEERRRRKEKEEKGEGDEEKRDESIDKNTGLKSPQDRALSQGLIV